MTIRGLIEETGILVDPHTAVAVAAARAESGLGSWPMVVLSTAHPAKFPEAVERASGRVPEQPERLRLRLGQHERCALLPNDYAAVASFIETNARAGGKAAASGKRRAEMRA
jgi:threonine synthase